MSDPIDIDQPKRLPRWAWRLLATGAILVLLPCLGLAGSFAYLEARQAGAWSRWRSLGAPPEGGVDIVTGDIHVVYVRAAAGSIYRCGEHRGRKVPDNCWQQASEPLSVDRKATFDKMVFQGDVEPPSGTVVDSLDVTVWLAEDAFETRYILLQDGTVWKWEYDVGSMWNLTILLLGPMAGLALGIVAVVLIWARSGLQSLLPRARQSRTSGEGM